MKQTSYITLISLISTLLFISCQKERFEQTTVTGKVLTRGTQEVIRHSPVRVVIYQQEFTSTFGSGPNYKVVSETISNEDGSFSLSASLGDDSNYFLGVDEETVNSRTYIWPSYGLIDEPSRKINARGGTLQLNYYLTARGWVRFFFTSTSPQAGDIYGYNLGGGASQVYYGNVEDEVVWDFAGNLEHQIALNKKINNNWINWQQSFFVPAFDTINYHIDFTN